MPQTVNIDAGEREYVDPPQLITATSDISTDTVEIGLGSWSTVPATWLPSSNAAVLLTRPATTQIQVTMLVGNTIRPASGDYWLYTRLTDTGGEVLIQKSTYRRVTVVNTGTVNYT
jgi:hypothetical protein